MLTSKQTRGPPESPWHVSWPSLNAHMCFFGDIGNFVNKKQISYNQVSNEFVFNEIHTTIERQLKNENALQLSLWGRMLHGC